MARTKKPKKPKADIIVAKKPATVNTAEEEINKKRVLKTLPGTKLSYWAWSQEELEKFPITLKDLGNHVQWAEYPSAKVTLLAIFAPDTPGWKDGGFKISVAGSDGYRSAMLDALKSKSLKTPKRRKQHE